MAFQVYLLYAVAFSLVSVEANIVQNCTASTCDLKTCVNTTQPCFQSCYTSNCRMACTSPQGCNMQCKKGGCPSLVCDVPDTTGINSYCEQGCLENCMDMRCKSRSCLLQCFNDNCKMTCHGTSTTSACYPQCTGRGCHIDVHSAVAEARCNKGSCIVRFSKFTGGTLACPDGNCTLTCAKGQNCELIGGCPNCTGPVYVDDPFKSNSPSQGSRMKGIFVLHLFAVLIFVLFA